MVPKSPRANRLSAPALFLPPVLLSLPHFCLLVFLENVHFACFPPLSSLISAVWIDTGEAEFTAPKVIIPAFFKKLLLEVTFFDSPSFSLALDQLSNRAFRSDCLVAQ
jgi:hypothetical protein